MRFIICGHKKSGVGAVVYVGKSGCATYSAEHCYVTRSIQDATEERDYRQRNDQRYSWEIQRLPARCPVSTAVLRAVSVA